MHTRIPLEIRVEERVREPEELLQQVLPIERIGFKSKYSYSTRSLNYNVPKTKVEFLPNMDGFCTSLDNETLVKVSFPGSNSIDLASEINAKYAVSYNLLSPIHKLLGESFRINPEHGVGRYVYDFCLVKSNEDPFVAVEVKQWNAFVDEWKPEDLKETSDVISALENSVDLSGSEGDDVQNKAWKKSLLQGTSNKRKNESSGKHNFRIAIKQLAAYLFEMKKTVAFGMLTSYCHTYFTILQCGLKTKAATLKISPVVKFNDNNVLRRIAGFIQMAFITKSESTNLTISLSPEQARDIQDDSEDEIGETKKRRKGQKEKKDGKHARSVNGDIKHGQANYGQYVMEGVIGDGRSGLVLQIVDSAGQLFAAKTVGEFKGKRKMEEKDIIRELHHEKEMYKILRNLQGEVVPRFHCSGYLENGMYTLVMDELDADPISKCNLSGDEKEAIVAALDKIHNLGILHCDIRGENILIERNSKCAYFVDFGMSTECDCKEDFKEEMNKLRTLLGMNLLP